MRLSSLMLVLVLFFGSACRSADVKTITLNDNISASVLVDTDSGAGSGVVFKNGGYTFVWTDAHVVSELRSITAMADPNTGETVTNVSYKDVWVQKDIVEDGRKVGEERMLAKIIRYGGANDIALLRLYKSDWNVKGVTFDFSIPPVGDDLVHVGCFKGKSGTHSVARGTVAAVGRLRSGYTHSDTNYPVVYDQYSGVAHHGSSGGGLFRPSGKCAGLITEYLDTDYDKKTKLHVMSYGSLCYTPSRRLRSWAKRMKCEWAVDHSVKVKSDEVYLQLTDGLVPLPEEVILQMNPQGPIFPPLPLPVLPLPTPKPTVPNQPLLPEVLKFFLGQQPSNPG